MAQTLIVIDCQDYFLKNGIGDIVLPGVKKQIKDAIRRNDHIVFVEFVDNAKSYYDKKSNRDDPTNYELLELVKGYNKVHFVYKNISDGGNRIVKVLRNKKLPRSNIKICGVYTEFCVKETAMTMAKILKKTSLYIIKSATTSYFSPKNKNDALKDMTFMYENINVI